MLINKGLIVSVARNSQKVSAYFLAPEIEKKGRFLAPEIAKKIWRTFMGPGRVWEGSKKVQGRLENSHYVFNNFDEIHYHLRRGKASRARPELSWAWHSLAPACPAFFSFTTHPTPHSYLRKAIIGFHISFLSENSIQHAKIIILTLFCWKYRILINKQG